MNLPGKKKSVRITCVGVYFKPALVQVAHAAVKAKESSYYHIKFDQITKRKGKKLAIIAVARMILTAVFSMMSTGDVWNPCDLYKGDMPDALKENKRLMPLSKLQNSLWVMAWLLASYTLFTVL